MSQATRTLMRSSSLDAPSSSLRLLAFLALASAVVSWPGRLENGLVCPDLHVTHNSASSSNGGRAVSMDASGVVSMVLLKDGEEVNCFQPGQNYEVELKSEYKQMRGVLWMLEPARGDFPLGNAPRNTKKNSLCDSGTMPHISHYCEDPQDHESNSGGCILGENGWSLKVGYRAPSDDSSVVTFRYTVVFTKEEFVQNEKKAFERCPAEATTESTAETTTDSPCPTENAGNEPDAQDNNLTSLDVDNNLTFDNTVSEQPTECNEFEPKAGAVETIGNCGLERSGSNESRSYTDPNTNVDYTCIIDRKRNEYARKIDCEPRCEKNGEPTICRIKSRKLRKRHFICTPTSEFPGFGDVFRDFEVEIQTKCECFAIADVDLNCSQATTEKPVRCRTATTTAIPTEIDNKP